MFQFIEHLLFLLPGTVKPVLQNIKDRFIVLIKALGLCLYEFAERMDEFVKTKHLYNEKPKIKCMK